MESLFECYCETRKAQHLVSKLLNQENLTSEESNFIKSIALEIQNTGNKIKCFCEKGPSD